MNVKWFALSLWMYGYFYDGGRYFCFFFFPPATSASVSLYRTAEYYFSFE